MKTKNAPRVTRSEKMERIQDYFANMLANKIYVTNLAQICHNCHLPNNGHTGDAVMAVCDQFAEATIVHTIRIGIGMRTRYDIELLP